MHDYYYRGDDEEEVVIQYAHNKNIPVSVRVSEGDDTHHGMKCLRRMTRRLKKLTNLLCEK